MPNRKVAFFGPQYGIGGAGRACADIGKSLAKKGYEVDFLVDGSYSEDGYLEERLPKNCHITKITDASYSSFRYNPVCFILLIFVLAKYLIEEKVDVLVSILTKFNILSVWTSFIPKLIRGLVVVEQNIIDVGMTGRSNIIPLLVKAHYPFSDEIVAVSSDVQKDLIGNHGISASTCTTIRNPVDVEGVISKSADEVDHNWFLDDTPVVLGVGRFVGQKQFSVLLRAFDLLVQHKDVRLVLAGDGPLREDLKALVVELEIEEHVDFLGFVENPYKYMRRAEVLGVSSKYEGFGVVLIEALACGTPIVSTNCPGGPSEILRDGDYGELVPVGNPYKLAEALARTLTDPPDREQLVDRARFYDVPRVADRYAEVIDRAAR